MGLRVYIAGPMRGIPQYNFPAFDAAKQNLINRGYIPISPADIDRDNGFDPATLPADHDWGSIESIGLDLREIVRRDLIALLSCDAVYLLDDWHKSIGATAEVAVARWLGLGFLSGFPAWSPGVGHFKFIGKADLEIIPTNIGAINPETKPTEDVLEEALRITKGDRNASYGPPDQDFARTAAMWSALKGVTFEAREVALFMIALKLSRETHQRKRDNWVDIAGYSRCGSMCR
jgi:hypothetical protein